MSAGGEFDIGELEEVIHGRVRLGIVSFLASAGGADFTELRDRLKVSDGNLSEHLRKLEEAGYLSIKKSFAGRRPRTHVRLTPPGRDAFLRYLEAMRKLVQAQIET